MAQSLYLSSDGITGGRRLDPLLGNRTVEVERMFLEEIRRRRSGGGGMNREGPIEFGGEIRFILHWN